MSTSIGKHGVTTWEVDKAWKGYTLFTPLLLSPKQLEGEKHTRYYLIDMKGDIVHHWVAPGMGRMHGELLPNGNLIISVSEEYNPIVVNQNESKRKRPVFCNTAIIELDWNSNVVWRYEDPYMDSHDRCRLRNGNTVYMRYEELPAEKAKKVKGGVPGTDYNGTMFTIVLVEVTPDGKIVDEMNLSEALDYDIDILDPMHSRESWPGLNSIEEMPDGTLVSTSYNLSILYNWDMKKKKVKWRFGGQGENKLKFYQKGDNKLSMPHCP